MKILGCDYSFSRPNIATLVSLGIKFAARYYSTPGNAKNLTSAEVFALTAYGIDIVSVFETSAGAAGGGFAAGRAAATSAGAQARALKQPLGTCIYYAVDYDANTADVAPYFEGIYSVHNGYSVGVYGGYYVCSGIRNLHPSIYTWQTAAWSGGKILPGVHIYQNAHTFNGLPDLDVNYAYQENYGGWKHAAPQPPRQEDAPMGAALLPDGSPIIGGIGTTGFIYLSYDKGATFKEVMSKPAYKYLPGLSLALQGEHDFWGAVRFPDQTVHVLDIRDEGTTANPILSLTDWHIGKDGDKLTDTPSISSTPNGDLLLSGRGTDGHVWVCERLSGKWGAWVKRGGTLL